MILLRKKMSGLLRIYTIILICTACSSYCDKAKSIDSNIESYANQYSPERLYIHYNKPGYSAGETVWFKVYMMNEVIPADESKTLYVDWIDDRGNLLLHTVSPLVEAV